MSKPSPHSLFIHQFMHESGEHALPMRIPRYQREYSWKKEEVRLLLDDIKSAMTAKEPYYFIGSILCIKRGEGDNTYHEIVDGQQRIATLSIVFAVVLHYIRDKKPSEKKLGGDLGELARLLEKSLYYGGGLLKRSASDDSYRLHLSADDNHLYHRLIKAGPVQKRNGRPQRFKSAYDTALSFLKEWVEVEGEGFILDFISFIMEKVCIIGVFVSSEVDAYEVFEAMNDRNRELTPNDLIKNKLLSCFGENKDAVDHAYEQWRATHELCGSPELMQEYVRCMLQMEAGIQIEPKKLYRHLKKRLSKTPKAAKEEAQTLLGNLYSHVHRFDALQRRDAPVWVDFDLAIKPSIAYLKQFKVVRTLMFAVMYVKTKPDFVLDIARIMERFIKRSRAVQERFSVMDYYEQEFARLAHNIKTRGSSAPKNSAEFFEKIKEIDAEGRNALHVIPNKIFIGRMSERGFKGAYARSVLLELSTYWQKQKNSDTLPNEDVITLEHVLPQTPKIEQWDGFEDKEHASGWVDRIGNLTLLESGRNTGISNKKFSDKKRLAYSKSDILLTKELQDYAKWTPEQVRERSKRLAELAAEIWSFKDFEKSPAPSKRRAK